MLSWIAIVIAAFALVQIWQTYSREKTKRDFKKRRIAKRLQEIEERESQKGESKDE